MPDVKQKPTPLKGYDPSKLREKLATVAKQDWDRFVPGLRRSLRRSSLQSQAST